jgi:hypothetical protein
VDDETVYDDGRVRVDSDGITLRRYYFPTGTAKHIRYSDIRSVDLRPMSWLTGKGRLWGTSSPRYWLPLEAGRANKHTLMVLDLGGKVSPAFTPDEPERARDLIERYRSGRSPD